MFRSSSIPSMPRGLFILLCVTMLTDIKVNGTRTRDGVSYTIPREWFENAIVKPQEFFLTESKKFREEMPDRYYQYGEKDYDYDEGYLYRQIVGGNRRSDSPPQTLPCDGRSPCPNDTEVERDINRQDQQVASDAPSTAASQTGENGLSTPVSNTPCNGQNGCQNAAAEKEDTQQDSQTVNDYSPQANFEEVQNGISKPPCAGGSPCPGSMISQEEMERAAIDRIKQNLLKQLNMKEPPNVSARDVDLSSPPIQRILRKHGIKNPRRLNEELTRDDSEDAGMTTKETVISYAKPPLIQGLTGIHFTFSEDDMSYAVKSAVIWLHIKRHGRTHGGAVNATLEFYRYQESRNGSLIAVKFNKKKIKVQQRGYWVKFVITNEVSKWFINSSSNFGIDIRCPELPDIISGVDQPMKKPILEVQVVHSQQSRRRRRSTELECGQDTEERACCRHNLTVSFSRLAWDWVIGPTEFESYHCYGDCMFLQLAGNYQRLHYMAGPMSRSKSCCSPTKLAPIKLIYFDHDGNVIFSQVDDMVIQKCGCV